MAAVCFGRGGGRAAVAARRGADRPLAHRWLVGRRAGAQVRRLGAAVRQWAERDRRPAPGEGFAIHIPRGYIYFAMAFSAVVEALNLLAKRQKKKYLKQREGDTARETL